MSSVGRLSRSVRLAIAIVALFVAGGCSPRGQEFVDGVPIGEPATCDDGCRDFIDQASRWLDQTAPGHPEIADAQAFTPDYRMPNGDTILTTRSGGYDLVVVLHLADHSVRAVLIGCGQGLSRDCFVAQPPRP